MIGTKEFNTFEELGDIINAMKTRNIIDTKIVLLTEKDEYIGYYNGSEFLINRFLEGPYKIKLILADLENVSFDKILQNKNRKMIIARKDRCKILVDQVKQCGEYTHRLTYLDENRCLSNSFNVLTDYSVSNDYKLTFEDIEANDWFVYFLD